MLIRAPKFLATLAVVVMMTLAAGGCGREARGDAGLLDTEPPAPRLLPVYRLSGTDTPEGFFNHPFPSDARMTASGAPDLRGFPEQHAQPLVRQLVRAVERDIRGFSPVGAIYFRFTAGIDPRTLPATAEASLDPGATVYLVNVDPSSPELGLRHPVKVRFRASAGRFWRTNTLVLQPPPSHPLLPGTRYAAVVTTGIRGSEGQEPEPSYSFQSLLGWTPPPGRLREWEALRELRRHLAAEPPRLALLVATVFTTANHLSDLREMRDWIHRQREAPLASHWRRVNQTEAFVLYEGRFNLTEYLTGKAPFTEPGAGVLRTTATGELRPVRQRSQRFALAVPRGAPPAGGWPLAIYAHGSDGTYHSFTSLEAEWAADAGIAMLSIDLPLHGERGPRRGLFETLLLRLAVSNPIAGRDLFRQGVLDHVQLVRLVRRGLVVPGSVSHLGRPIPIRASRPQFVGYSMGGQIGALLAAVEPDIDAVLLAGAGGGITTSFLRRHVDGMKGTALPNAAAALLGLDTASEPLVAHHPLLGLLLQTAFDPADPLAYASGLLGRSGEPRSGVLLIGGQRDRLTPPATSQALATAAGLPVLRTPSLRDKRVQDGSCAVARPLLQELHGNIHSSRGSTTGALVLYADYGHGALYSPAGAKQLFQRWLRSSADGASSIVPIWNDPDLLDSGARSGAIVSLGKLIGRALGRLDQRLATPRKRTAAPH